eukprot:7383395-Prymnesium_polylepis.2
MLVEACTVSATFRGCTGALVCAASSMECTTTGSVSSYGAARSRNPAADRMSGTSTWLVPSIIASMSIFPVEAGSRSQRAPSRAIVRAVMTGTSSTLQLAPWATPGASMCSVTLSDRC